jgi:G protein beta subunit-like protein
MVQLSVLEQIRLVVYSHFMNSSTNNN